MTTNKSSFTFCLKDGTDYEFEVEPVYINTKTQLVEPLSASSRTTPRDKKVPFGPVKKVTVIDEQVIKIENEPGDEVFLEVQKLSPLIDKEDSRLKKELINLQNKDTNVLAQTLNDLINKMHGEEFRKNMSVNLLKRQSTLQILSSLMRNKERLQAAVVRRGWKFNSLEEGPDTACAVLRRQRSRKQKMLMKRKLVVTRQQRRK